MFFKDTEFWLFNPTGLDHPVPTAVWPLAPVIPPILVSEFTISVITPQFIKITVTAPESVQLLTTRPDLWSISTVEAIAPMEVLAIESDGAIIILYTTEATQGGNYTLHIPYRFILNSVGDKQCTTQTLDFVGVGVGAMIHHIEIANDLRSVDVIFNEDVLESDALNPANYTIAGITISEAFKMATRTYRLIVSDLSPGTAYTVQANVRDIYYNA